MVTENNDDIKQLPSGNKDKNIKSKSFNPNDSEGFTLLPSAEAYEALGKSVDLQILELKRKISKELQDELLSIQYRFTALEQKAKEQEIRILQLEAENKLLRDRNEKLVSASMKVDELRSPKEESEFDETQYSDEGALTEDNARNIKGIGGKPGSLNSRAVVYGPGQFQGDNIRLDDETELIYDKAKSQYALSGGKGLRFTFFAVEAAYLEEGYINPNYPQFYSQNILQKQVWYERTPRNRLSDGVGEQYSGRVPLELLMSMLNERVNTARLLPDGSLMENQPFNVGYKNWRYTYQVGTYYKAGGGDLYTVLEVDESKSKGNAPKFRTDFKPSSKTYGQAKATSAAEIAKWNNSLIPSGRKKLFSRKKPNPVSSEAADEEI